MSQGARAVFALVLANYSSSVVCIQVPPPDSCPWCVSIDGAIMTLQQQITQLRNWLVSLSEVTQDAQVCDATPSERYDKNAPRDGDGPADLNTNAFGHLRITERTNVALYIAS
jgi:hypothetical protein